LVNKISCGAAKEKLDEEKSKHPKIGSAKWFWHNIFAQHEYI
jgi:hypothetical protein